MKGQTRSVVTGEKPLVLLIGYPASEVRLDDIVRLNPECLVEFTLLDIPKYLASLRGKSAPFPPLIPRR